MASSDKKVERLKAIPLFAHASDQQLGRVAAIADEVHVAPGATIIREGERGQDFFIIESGSAKVTHAGSELAELGPGDFFGEMSLLDGGDRNATVAASSDSELLVVRKPAFDSLREQVPGLSAAILTALGERIRGLEDSHTH